MGRVFSGGFGAPARTLSTSSFVRGFGLTKAGNGTLTLSGANDYTALPVNAAEIEAVLAHELTHIRNRDVRLLVIAVIFVSRAIRIVPQQNAYVERFNRTVRCEWLSQYYWQISTRFNCSRPIGCTTTIMIAHTRPWADLHQNSGWPWPRNSTSERP